MTLINLKFSPEMERLIISGKKCCTTRDEKKGEVGDVFRIVNRIYRIVQVDGVEFGYVSTMYNAEGFSSDVEFEDAIRQYYPDIAYDDEVYIHFFAYVYEECEKCRHQNSANQKSATS